MTAIEIVQSLSEDDAALALRAIRTGSKETLAAMTMEGLELFEALLEGRAET